MVVVSWLLVLLVLADPTNGWSSSTDVTRRRRPRTHRKSLFQLRSVSPEGDSELTGESGSSRRAFFGNIAAAAASAGWMLTPGSPGFQLLPANAADLVKTTSVCDPAVSVWQKSGRFIYLLGTAHVSAVSAQLAGQLVRDIHPNAVFVELDKKRISGSGVLAQKFQEQGGKEITSKVVIPQVQVVSSPSLAMESGGQSATTTISSSSPPPSSSTKPNPVMRVATAGVGNAIKGMYKKLDNSGFKAGEEFVVTMREGIDLGADVVLGDRDVEVTLRRLTEAIAQTDLKLLMSNDSEMEKLMPENSFGVDSDFSDPEVRDSFASFVEVIKAKENVRKIMTQLKSSAPALYEALVSERDGYMAAALNSLNDYEAIVAVVGIAHTDGIEMNLNQNGWKAVNLNCPDPSR